MHTATSRQLIVYYLFFLFFITVLLLSCTNCCLFFLDNIRKGEYEKLKFRDISEFKYYTPEVRFKTNSIYKNRTAAMAV